MVGTTTADAAADQRGAGSVPEAVASRPPVGPAKREGRRLPHVSAIVVLLVGLALTGAASLSARAVHDTNEKRLLRERVQEAALLFNGVFPSVETPLASAAEVADATHAARVPFSRVMGPLVGPGRQFVSASIWHAGSAERPHPLLAIGERPELESQSPARIRELLGRAATSTKLVVDGLLTGSNPRVTYAFAAGPGRSGYIAYAEAALPKNRKSRVIQRHSAFSDLGYAIYLGSKEQPANLLTASTTDLPLGGRRAAITIPFGDNSLRLVMTPNAELGGSLLARLPWMLLVLGLLLSFGAAGLTERLVRRREEAQRLAEELGRVADENARLYAVQRTVAETLQHSLLPERLPAIAGIDLGVRYVAGAAGMDVGGDWYDAIPRTDGRIVFVVGDVSGRGLPAATVMASLRYAIRAYAAQGDDPATILNKLAALLDVEVDGQFATVMCVLLDVDAHSVELANAGHLEPLLLDGDRATFVTTEIGLPIGVRSAVPYESVSVSVPERATLIAFTDGLVERRGESLDVGLERLRETAIAAPRSLEQLLTTIETTLLPDGPADDTAILGVTWKS